MKSKSTIFNQLFLIVAILFTFSLSAWGEEMTISFASTAQRVSQDNSKQVWKNGDVTFTNNKASSTTNVGNFSNPVRLYANSQIVIEVPGNITKIVAIASSSSYATALKNSVEDETSVSGSTVTITPTASATSYIIKKLTAQVRLNSITVTYTPPTTPTLEIEPASIDFGDEEQNTLKQETFTIAGSNLTGEITLTLDNTTDFSIDKSFISANTANSEQTITVTLNAETIGKKEGKITISTSGVNNQIVSLSANVIAPKQKFNVRFWHNGENVKTIQIAEGESLGEFPIIDILESCNSNLPTFAGWVTDYVGYENIENTTTPTFFVPTQPINGETNLYAVFADASNESTWNLVKNVSELADGSKVIIACPTKNAAAGTQNGSYRNSTSISLSSEQITDIQSSIIFTLGNTSSGYSFYSDNEKHYMVLTSDANAVHTVNSLSKNEHYWNITISGNATSITNKGYTNRKLQYNASSPRFACYTSSQTAIALYKKTSAQATKWTVCTPNDAPELTKLTQPQNLNLTATENSITAIWDIVDNASGYIVSVNGENSQEIDNNTITISNLKPETEYSISIVAKGDNVSFKNSDETKASIITSAITPAQKYIVTFHYNDGSEKILETSILEGLAGYAPTLSEDNHNITFIGWSKEEITEDLTECPDVYDNETSEVLTGDLDLYPIYSSQQTTIKPFDLSSTEPQQVVIAANINDKWYALPKSLPKPNGGTQSFELLKVETTPLNYVTLANANDYIWTISKTPKGYTIFNGDNYLSGESSGTKLYANAKDSVNCTISKEDDNYEIRPSTATDRSIIFRTGSYNVVGHYKTSNIDNEEYYQPTILPVINVTKTYSSTPKWYVEKETNITSDIYADIVVSSGAKLNVTATADINTLTIKSNLDKAGEVNVTDGALSANKVIIEKTIDSTRWFFFSLPFDCQIDDIVAIAANGDSLTYDTHYVISKYNPTRAEGANNAWEELLDTKLKLNANQGYIIGHWYKPSDSIIVKFPSTDAQTISVPEDKTLNYTDTWFVGGENSSKGFNLIGMPYYQKVSGNLTPNLVTIPNKDGKTYTQTDYTNANIAPFTSFFVQVAENTAPKFTISTKSSSAPMLRAKDVVAKATITLADANGGTDATTIINNPANTTDYEIGHDLVKWIGYAEIPQIYSLQGDEMLAFNSLAIDNSTVILLGVYAHADGEYTFALSEKSIGDLHGWELYDNETGKTTRLANEELTVYLEQGTHDGRFEIRLQQRITTDCDNAMGDMMTWTANDALNISNIPADAVVYIYDAVGRMIYVATPNATTFNYNFVARGVYNIVVRTAGNAISFKTIY